MHKIMKLFSLALISVTILSSCGFHLRGKDGSYQFPFKRVFLECDTAIICQGFKTAIQREGLTQLVTNRESAEVIILVGHEQTSRDTYNFNSVGQIASYLLTYQITAQIYNPQLVQIMPDIVVQNQMVMAYNNSLILSAKQQEETLWDEIHQNVISTLIRRLVYAKPKLVSTNAAESN